MPSQQCAAQNDSEVTYRQVVKVREQEENAQQRDETEEDGAHRALAARLLVHLASTIPSKRRDTAEAPTDKVCDTEGNQLAVRTQLHALDGLAAAETLSSDRRLKEAEESDEKRVGHGFADVCDIGRQERPAKDEQAARRCLDVAENLNTQIVPSELPAEDDGSYDDDEAVRDEDDRRKSWLEILLPLAVESCKLADGRSSVIHLPGQHTELS